MIAVIVPFARPKMAENVWQSFVRQLQPHPAQLIVVENGPGIGGWRYPSIHSHVRIQSEHGRSHARTAGLHKARELGCEWYAFWDDDDVYEAGYLEFMWQHRELADVIGLCQFVLRDSVGRRRSVRCREPGPVTLRPGGMLVDGICSASLFGRTDRALDWTKHPPFSAELDWYTDMHEAGRTLYGLADPNPKEPLMYQRRFRDIRHGHALPEPQWEKHPNLTTLIDPPQDHDLRLHLGSGPNYLEGWLNHDRDIDLRKPLPWPDGSAELIFCEHTIEHIAMPEGMRFVEECYRVLKPGGTLRLSFPDVERVWALSKNEVEQRAAAIRQLGLEAKTREDCVRLVLTGWDHQSAWTERLALVVLQAAGFAARPVSYGKSAIAGLDGVDSHHLVSGDAARLETSVVEGIKPSSKQSSKHEISSCGHVELI